MKISDILGGNIGTILAAALAAYSGFVTAQVRRGDQIDQIAKVMAEMTVKLDTMAKHSGASDQRIEMLCAKDKACSQRYPPMEINQ